MDKLDGVVLLIQTAVGVSYFLHPVVLHVSEVYLGAINTAVNYKPILKCLIFRFFYLHLPHVFIYQDHHQVAFLNCVCCY
jgi:hypothetical protein